jgi:hypothetical protein
MWCSRNGTQEFGWARSDRDGESDQASTLQNPTEMTRRKELALVGGITLLGAALRLYQIGAQSLWLDELFSILVALTAGEHIVRFEFDPVPWRVGAIITLITVGALALIGTGGAVRSFRRK